jgi:hypothetical protein
MRDHVPAGVGLKTNVAALRPWKVLYNVYEMRDNLPACLLPQLTPAEMARIDTVVPPGGGRKIWPA